ncbi:HEXXH motif-containing putative peptide modification protein [Streptomyces sp. V4I8]|uniref:aKG-HExxH-type peptide beta-hydroxylase n=1 Tax=Streptomyces sp. V4I8 TaxID=3156469 RepID=UPI003514ADEB
MLEDIDQGLTESSVFAESAPVLAKVDATFSLAAEIASDHRHGQPSRPLPDIPFAYDTVFRRELELFLHRMRERDPQADTAADFLSRTDLVAPPGPDSSRQDARFTPLGVPGGRTVRVLSRIDDGDAWTAQFQRIFRAGLTEPDSRYRTVPATAREAGVVSEAVRLLGAVLPRTALSVLSHLAFVGVVEGPGAFESASDRRVPRAVFINRCALDDVPRTAEAVLHECVHQKLYDIQLVHPIYRAAYDAEHAAVIRPPWHENAEWSFDRALAAAHVYVHLAAFYTALGHRPQSLAQGVDAATGRSGSTDRARFLLAAVAGVPAEPGPAGVRFIEWLTARLRQIEACPVANAKQPQKQGVL